MNQNLIEFLTWVNQTYVIANGEYFHKDAENYWDNPQSYEMIVDNYTKNVLG